MDSEKYPCDWIPCVKMRLRLSDKEVWEWSQADLLCMPMLDSAANNVFLESMACGTPVMTNRVGGVPEYVPGNYNVLMPVGADADNWAARLEKFADNRDGLERWRPEVRQWAEGLDWKNVEKKYRAMYRELDRLP